MVNKNEFEIMIADFLADHVSEYSDDPLTHVEIKWEKGWGWVCYAEDSRSSYILHDGGDGNILIDYIGTK